MGQVQLEIGGQTLHEITPARTLCGFEGLLLPHDRIGVLTHFGRCHRHRFDQLDWMGLPCEKTPRDRHRAAAITNAIVGCCGQHPSGRVRECHFIRIAIHRLGQPIACLPISGETDERRGIAETRFDGAGFES